MTARTTTTGTAIDHCVVAQQCYPRGPVHSRGPFGCGPVAAFRLSETKVPF